MDILRCGIEGVLVELEDRDQAHALRTALRTAPPEGVVELVPAARTLLVRFDRRRTGFARLREMMISLPLTVTDHRARAEIVVPVRYDGADLTEVASATGLTRAEVIRRHTAARYAVAFCGFAPGFAYLTGLDPALHLPRRATPRTAVPAGSVALADEYTGVYPRSSPGGWRLIGTSELAVWDLERNPPTVLVPGSEVRFEAVGS
ncbi:MAG: 5-oxoprolinase subunit B family protein [Pseudonocardia sp.]